MVLILRNVSNNCKKTEKEVKLMRMLKNVAFIIPGMAMGGAERVVSVIANSFMERDIKCTIYVYNDIQETHLINPNVTIININWEKMSIQKGIVNKVKTTLLNFRRITDAVRKNRPDVIIAFLGSALLPAALTGKVLKIPVVLSERNNPFVEKSRIYQKLSMLIAYSLSQIVVFQTERIRSKFPLYIRKKSKIINNPLLIECPVDFKRTPTKIILNTGRLDKQKDQITLIKAFALIAHEFPEYKLIICGEGPERDNLERSIDELNLNNRVVLVGAVNNVEEYLKKAEIFVFTSIHEGYPNSLVEAMAAGLPVIATDCPFGPAEMIKTNENGILVPIKNCLAISDAMKKLLVNPLYASKLGEKAKEIHSVVEKDAVINLWQETLISVITE